MDFLGGSVWIGRFSRINVRVHILYLVWMGFQLFTARGAWRDELEFMAMLFGIILVHEFGHCFGARSVGGDATEILMWPLGGLAFARAPMRAWPQFVTVACGPLVNVLFCLGSAALLIFGSGQWDIVSANPFARTIPYGGPTWAYYAAIFFDVNKIILAFNLLPIFPLDGGQLFRAIIWPLVGLRQATIIASWMGILGAAGLAMLAISSGQTMLIAIAIFGGMTCWQHLMAAKQGYMEEEREWVTTVRPRRRGFWARLFGPRSAARSTPPNPHGRPSANPNPGGWDAKLEEERRLSAEVDRILQKVHQEGVQSLSYVERQTLESATRRRRDEEREIYRDTR